MTLMVGHPENKAGTTERSNRDSHLAVPALPPSFPLGCCANGGRRLNQLCIILCAQSPCALLVKSHSRCIILFVHMI